MCGIVGVVSKVQGGLFYTDMDIFENMLVCDSLRGQDSTGVFGVYKNRQARTLKVAAEPHMLFRCNEWGDFRTKAQSSMQLVVGHNRYATKGAVNTQNAHPFAEGNIVLVHNGTLHNQKDFNKDVEVDSHAIAHALNERDAKDVLKDVNGAFAFVWYDRSKSKLFIARNSERPLSFVETSSNIYFASEAGMLDFVLNRKTGSYAPAQPFPVGKLISIDAKGHKEEEDFELYRPKSYTQGYSSRGMATIPGNTTDSKGRLERGLKVLVKLEEVTVPQTFKGETRVRGKLLSHAQGIDATGIISSLLGLNDAYDMIKMPYVEATIAGYWDSACGLSYNLKEIQPAEMVTLHNNTKLPMIAWKQICETHKCDKCGGDVQLHQASFTSVKPRSTTKTPRVICGECVLEALDDKTTPDIENSSFEVQARESLSKITPTSFIPEAKQDCTVH
jgi:hypothetical protein